MQIHPKKRATFASCCAGCMYNMRPKDSRGSLPEYFHDFLFDSIAEGDCQSGSIKWAQLCFPSRFSTKRGPIISCSGVLGFLRQSSSTTSSAVLDEGEKLGHVSIISAPHDLSSESKDGASVVSMRFNKIVFSSDPQGWMEEACLWYDWYQTGPPEPWRSTPPPFSPNVSQPITQSVTSSS